MQAGGSTTSASITCPNCGRSLKANAKFCGGCGQKIGSAPVLAPEAIPPQRFQDGVISRQRVQQGRIRQERFVQTTKQKSPHSRIQGNTRRSPRKQHSRRTRSNQKSEGKIKSQVSLKGMDIDPNEIDLATINQIVDSRRDLIFAVNFKNELHELDEKLDLMERYKSFKKADFYTLQKETEDVLKKMKDSKDYNVDQKILDEAREFITRSNVLQLKMLEWMTLGSDNSELENLKNSARDLAAKLEEAEKKTLRLKGDLERIQYLKQITQDFRSHLLNVTEVNATLKSAISWNYQIKEDLEKLRETLFEMSTTEVFHKDLAEMLKQLDSLTENTDVITVNFIREEIEKTLSALEEDGQELEILYSISEQQMNELSHQESQIRWQYIDQMEKVVERMTDTQILINHAHVQREEDEEKERNKPVLQIREEFHDGEPVEEKLADPIPLRPAEPLQEGVELSPIAELTSPVSLAPLAPLQRGEYLLEIHQEKSDPVTGEEVDLVKSLIRKLGFELSAIEVDTKGIHYQILSWGINKFTIWKKNGVYKLACRKRNFLSRFSRIEFSSDVELKGEITDPYYSIIMGVRPKEKTNSLLYFRSLGEKFLKVPGEKLLSMQNQGSNTLYIEVTFQELTEGHLGAITNLVREIDLVVNGI